MMSSPVRFLLTLSVLFSSTWTATASAHKKYTSYVEACLNTLIEHGSDRYGVKTSPILASILDVETLTCPQDPLPLDEHFRVNRRERRNPAGANLLTDQPLLRSMYETSRLTGQTTYARAADRYIAYYLEHLVDGKGLIWWGWHRHYDVFTDRMDGHQGNHHEIHAITDIDWGHLWRVNKEVVTKEIESIWQWHIINKETGENNRHGDGQPGCDFSMSAGSHVQAFAFMYERTRAQQWLDRARLVADYYWQRRHPKTNLIVERPNAGTGRFDGSAFVTAITGPHCFALLDAWQRTGDEAFKTYAVAYLKAYAEYGFDESTGKFFGALKTDGSVIPGPRLAPGSAYGVYEPRGHLDLWEPYVAGYQFPIYTAQLYIWAYELTQEPVFLESARRFAAWIEKTPPGTVEQAVSWYAAYTQGAGTQGTYAGKYGRALSFFLHLYGVTQDKTYLQQAQQMADEAVKKLFTHGIFRGHPAKPYYESMDGVGYLLNALLDLDLMLEDPKGKHQLVNW